MTEIKVSQRDKITDLLQSMLNAMHGEATVETLDRVISDCLDTLGRMGKLRKEIKEAEEGATDNGFPTYNLADLIRWDQIAHGIEVPF